MSRWFWILCWLLISSCGWGQESGKLPAESESVLRKLREWEFKERAKLESELGVKRDEVEEVLRRHLETYTKRGDLKTATAVLAEIEKLENEGINGPGEMTFEMPWREGKLEGMVWVTFHPDGTATWENKVVKKTFERGFRWLAEESGGVELWYQGGKKGEGMSWLFSKDFTSARVRHRKEGTNLKSTRIR